MELCAALTGAQVARLLRTELNLSIQQVVLWTDSTAVLTWLKSDSCHFEVFVGTRVTEIQDPTASDAWRYVPSGMNPAGDITQGKPLSALATDSHWSCSPDFLLNSPDQWPDTLQLQTALESSVDLRKPAFCGLTSAPPPAPIPDITQFTTFSELVTATVQSLHGVAEAALKAEDFCKAQTHLLQ